MLEFIGKFHPVIVHLPIGIFVLAILFEFMALTERFKKIESNISFILTVGIGFSILSLVTGLLLSQDGSNNKTDVDLHKWIAIATTFLFIFYQVWRNQLVQKTYAQVLALIILSTGIVLTGHFGGSLTHGKDFISFSNIDKEEKLVKALVIPDINQAVLYKDIVQHTLTMKCVQCHGEERQKGKLRLDDQNWILAGGKNGNVINLNQPEQSELLKRLLLEDNDEYHMPPKDKEQLTGFEKTILQWWITSGASFDSNIASMQPDEKTKLALAEFKKTYASGEIQKVIQRKEVNKISASLKQDLEKDGWVISAISKDDNHIRAVGYNLETPRDLALKKLLPIKEQLVELKLTSSGITDKDLSIVKQLSNIEKLWLDENEITDQGIKDLVELKNLFYINLTFTSVSKIGIEQLMNNKAIESVYLYQTGLNQTEISALKDKWKNIKIYGADTMIKMPSDTLFQKRVK
jgi:uncharacterized membrane protein